MEEIETEYYPEIQETPVCLPYKISEEEGRFIVRLHGSIVANEASEARARDYLILQKGKIAPKHPFFLFYYKEKPKPRQEPRRKKKKKKKSLWRR